MNIKRFGIRSIAAAVLVISIAMAAGAMLTARAQSDMPWGPKWTANGELILPQGYHWWIFLGSPITPNALNGGAANFPEYHNVYVHPEAFEAYKKSGEWPEGTILLKELQLTFPG